MGPGWSVLVATPSSPRDACIDFQSIARHVLAVSYTISSATERLNPDFANPRAGSPVSVGVPLLFSIKYEYMERALTRVYIQSCLLHDMSAQLGPHQSLLFSSSLSKGREKYPMLDLFG